MIGHFLANIDWWFSFLRWVRRYPAFREIFLMILGVVAGIYFVTLYWSEPRAGVLGFVIVYLVSWIVHAISDRGGFLEMGFWLMGAFLWGYVVPLAFAAVRFLFLLLN